jgi:hypothetical protein
MIENLWYVSLSECFTELMKEENYGYGLDCRKIKKGLKTNPKTVQRHYESYCFFLEAFCSKLLHSENEHPPLWVIQPESQQAIAYWWWDCFFSYKWQGAKRI